jgi:hypothetical protein
MEIRVDVPARRLRFIPVVPRAAHNRSTSQGRMAGIRSESVCIERLSRAGSSVTNKPSS